MKTAFRLAAVSAAFLLAQAGLAPLCFAQDQATGRALGVVTKMDAAARQITLKTDTGEVAVAVDPKPK